MLPNKHFLKFHVSERKHSIAAFFLMVGDTKLARNGVVCDIKEHEEMVPGHEQEEMGPGTLQRAFMYHTGQ